MNILMNRTSRVRRYPGGEKNYNKDLTSFEPSKAVKSAKRGNNRFVHGEEDSDSAKPEIIHWTHLPRPRRFYPLPRSFRNSRQNDFGFLEGTIQVIWTRKSIRMKEARHSVESKSTEVRIPKIREIRFAPIVNLIQMKWI
jgi:hypothetical protein